MALVAVSALAQTNQEAMTLGQNKYYGTARTIGMGNAVSAVGADLGSIGINPAGSAVAGYSQFTVSPGVILSASTSNFAPSYYNTAGAEYGEDINTSSFRAVLPNIGFTLRFETGNRVGVKSYTFGFVSNQTNNYFTKTYGYGREANTSITGAMAAGSTYNADGNGNILPYNILSNSEPFHNLYYWDYVASYWGGLTNYNVDKGEYYGSAEDRDQLAVNGLLNQSSTELFIGSKNDVILNLGLDINENLFVGFNLGIPVFNYKYSRIFNERSVNYEDFPVTPEYYGSKTGEYVREESTYYLGSMYNYEQRISGTGVYFKAGAIWLPTKNLRLAAAIQTPTYYSIEDDFAISTESYFQSGNDGFSDSPTAENYYSFRSPYSFNVGAAYTFGTAGLISVDYEMTDFSVMKYDTSEYDGYYDSGDAYYEVNRLNKLFCGASHALRIGAEYRPLPYLTLRAGYNLTTSPERYYIDNEGYEVYSNDYANYFNDYEKGLYTLDTKKTAGDPVHSISLGFGISSPGSFFADFALRRTGYKTSYYMYSDYIENYVAPHISTKTGIWDAVVTFGWRF